MSDRNRQRHATALRPWPGHLPSTSQLTTVEHRHNSQQTAKLLHTRSTATTCKLQDRKRIFTAPLHPPCSPQHPSRKFHDAAAHNRPTPAPCANQVLNPPRLPLTGTYPVPLCSASPSGCSSGVVGTGILKQRSLLPCLPATSMLPSSSRRREMHASRMATTKAQKRTTPRQSRRTRAIPCCSRTAPWQGTSWRSGMG